MFDRNKLISFLPSGICAEIGVATGDFSNKILYNNNPTMLHLIDSWENFDLGYHDGNMVSQEQHDKRYQYVTARFADKHNVSVKRGKSIKVLAEFPDDFFDWVYIDADHSYQGCLNDLIAAMPKMKNHGYICGHDYLADGFTRQGFGVNQAVNTFVREFNYKLMFITEEKEYKSYVLVDGKNKD